MKKFLLILSLIFTIFCNNIHAQIEKVFVEIYYISDQDDATNQTGGQLPLGSKTYRVYVDLMPGSKILRMYGDENHLLKISSTADFFNNTEDGVNLGYEMNKARYSDNTVALDSWLTIGQTSKSGNNVQFGIPKNQDTDGSFIGGTNNDGGSESIEYGLLKNNSPDLGIPLTTSDGMMPNVINQPSAWFSQGFNDVITNKDITVFGNEIVGNVFESNFASIRNSGTLGVNADSNYVLVAQLTTLGDISFSLNFEIEDKDGIIKKYVDNGGNLQSDETLLPILNYPPVCGCKDPDYLEYDVNFSCNDNSKCKNKIVFGCMNPDACNFNASANYNIESLCCFIGYCNDLDIDVVCPNLPPRFINDKPNMIVYPNPSNYDLNIEHNIDVDSDSKIEIMDVFGNLIETYKTSLNFSEKINISHLSPGHYIVRLTSNETSMSKSILKIN